MGARQLVVQLALETITSLLGSKVSWLTPTTNVFTLSGSLVGAEMTTRFAPACRCLDAPS